MLHRSFKPAKCKTTLKLASSRLKLMKNKKDVQVKQMKKELAQLLEAGQDQTARIRVEHVVREEKTMAAFDLLEIYCELIVARLPIIESQKNCPIDLKEAVTSVIFASPRCADIPELSDVRKQFTVKYGKEFITSAVELRPDCGVSRMIVEKLSAKGPDGPTKIKILSAIAEEHNIKWEPKQYGETELKPPDDLLNGPNTFEKASKMHAAPPIVQTPPSNVQASPSSDQKYNPPVNFEHNVRSSTSSQNFASTDIGGGQATTSATSHPGVRPSGTGSKRVEERRTYSGDGNDFSSGGQNWNMDFKDATAAAQAAAESAERASMAARAAAELSSRGKFTSQYSAKSQNSNVHNVRDDGPRKSAASKLPTEQFAKDSGYNNFQDRNPQIWTEQVGGNKHDNPDEAPERFYRDGHGSTKRSSQSTSLRSNTASIDDSKLMNDFQKVDRYSQKSSFEEEAAKSEKSAAFSGMSMKKQSSGSEVEFVSARQGGLQSNNFNYAGEERIRRQGSSGSSHSHSSNRGDDYDVGENPFVGIDHGNTLGDVLPSSHQKFGNDAGENPFVSMDQGNVHRDTVQTSSYNNDDAVVFDGSGSDDDDCRFDPWPKYDGHESNLFSTSPVREPPAHLPVYTHTWSPRQNTSESLEKTSSVSHVSAEWHSPPRFDENLTKSAHTSQPDDLVPVAFDDSEDPSSESEDELNKSRLGGKTDPSILSHKESIFFRNPGDARSEGDYGSNRKQDRHYSSNDNELVEVSAENNQGTEFSAESRRKFGFDEVPTRQSSSRHTTFQTASNDMTSEPFYNPVKEEKHQLSPQSSKRSLVDEVKATDNPRTSESPDPMKDYELFEKSSLESGNELLSFGPLTGGLRNKGYRRPPYSKSPSGDAASSKKVAEDSVTTTDHSSASSPAVKSSLNSEVITEVKSKSSSRTPITHYESDTDDFEEELPQQNSHSERGPQSAKASKELYTKSKFSPPVAFFDSDDDDSKVDLPKQTSTSTGRAGSGFSRRTKGAPSSRTSSYSKTTAGSDASLNSDADAQKIPLRRSSYGSETQTKPWSQKVDSGRLKSSPDPSAAKQSTFKPMPESRISTRGENLKSSATEQPSSPLRTVTSTSTESSKTSTSAKKSVFKPPESHISMRGEKLKSSATEQPSSPLRTVTSASTESLKTSASSRDPPSRESSLKKGSHVHPKLPDYDTIAAQLQSLRTNRQ